MRPDFCAIEGERLLVSLLFRHDLNGESPLRVVMILDRRTEIAAEEIRVFASYKFCLRYVQTHVLEVGEDMEFDPKALTAVVDQTEGVATVSVHVPIRGGRTIAISKYHQSLMDRFGVIRDKVPKRISVPFVATRISFECMDGIRTDFSLSDIEHRSIDG